jgi:glycosyltransferase involved in cell wall biosynthesis
MNIYGFAPVSGATHWYRIREPLRALAGLGHTTEFGELFDDSVVNRADTILTHILHDEQGTLAWKYLAEAGQHRLIYDIDDNLWQYPSGTEHHKYWTPERKRNVEENMRLAHLVTTPSRMLADHLVLAHNLDPRRIAVLPNYIPQWVLDVKRTTPKRFTIGWQAAPQRIHQGDLDEIQAELFITLDKCPDARLLFFGQAQSLEGAGPFADRIDFIPWTPVMPDYYRSLHCMTVGIAPLQRSPFADCKSGVRAAEYLALGIPGVYSSVPAYRDMVLHRETGYLATFHTHWRQHLIKLYRSPDLVERISTNAREIGIGWTIEQNGWRWEQAYLGSGPGGRVPQAH